MKIGDEVYYKFRDGTFAKVKLTDVKMGWNFDGETEINGEMVKLKDIPATHLVEIPIYQSELFKSMNEMENLT